MIIKLSEGNGKFTAEDLISELNSTSEGIGEPIEGLTATVREMLSDPEMFGLEYEGDISPEEIFIKNSGYDPDRTYTFADDDVNRGIDFSLFYDYCTPYDDETAPSGTSGYGGYGTYKGLNIGWYNAASGYESGPDIYVVEL